MEIQLHFTQRGQGFPLVLLHGNGEDGGYFSAQLEAFYPRFRVIALDTRGHGQSPRGTAPFTLEQFALDLKDFLDAQGLSRVILLGFSDGANVALLFSLKWPEYVEKLILNGGDLSPAGVKAHVQLPIVLGWAAASLCARLFPGARPNAELLSLMVTQPHIDPAELGRLSMPVLVIAGSRDMIRESHTRSIAAAIPGARLVILPGDHFLAQKNSAAFNRAVEQFLQA